MNEFEAAAARDAAAAPCKVPQWGTSVGVVDLSPFGSPASIGATPARLTSMKAAPRGASTASNDDDDASDNASVRDQRTGFVDAAQLHKTLKQMQEMAEENRKLQQFLSEYRMDAEKLAKLEEENQALRGVTRQLEQELQDIKVNALPRTGAELEMFKNAVHVPAVARSVCSNDESVVLGPSTASLDGANPGARVARQNVFKSLLAHLGASGPSTGTSQPATPRSVGASGGGASVDGATVAKQRKQPRPEEAAALGQAVYQLLDSWGGRMM
ncbi:hypothetical protein GPECTOR_2g1173 [Gonium pectorale]|uniref:Uncharacterized protein n=1 Tax=Gonium pectorale TaxID=33097 RepID=A0A150H0U3_GONPE|nr:hypothetical protein GPECTOR_2g1173 [Gonium pectorale]|eukprot:KXZ55623.1 hypothetical protein GPECTOR_2g1173 [Gonium pectorale]